MRQARPWGLPDDLLAPAKTQTDPIHHDIYWIELEHQIIDSRAFQRLRHVKQLGNTLKIYPGAEHSRFTHGLGTLGAAQAILDKIQENHLGPHRVPSLLDDWVSDGCLPIKLAEATILTRLAALLHDLGHVPFGHTIEDDLNILMPHDKNEDRFDRLWRLLPRSLRSTLESARTVFPMEGRKETLFDELRAIILDKVEEDPKHPSPRSLYPFVADVVNNTICADLLDYSKRDHYFMGLPFSVGDRFMDNFFIAPANEQSKYKERLVVHLTRDGEARTDIRTELLKHLRYRYEATERALYHKTKLAYDAMLVKLLEMWRDALWHREAIDSYPELVGAPEALEDDWLREQVAQLHSVDLEKGVQRPSREELDNRIDQELERYLTFFGDEGFLEYLIWTLRETPEVWIPKRLVEPGKPDEAVRLDERWDGVRRLAERIRYREHFRMLGYARGPEALDVAGEKYEAYGGPAPRRALERRVAKMAQIDPAWQVVIWLPSPTMRLKQAKVLVKEGQVIRPLAGEEGGVVGDEDAAMIVERHKQLWALRVYGPKRLRAPAQVKICERVLSYIGRELNVPMRRWDGQPVPPPHVLAAQEVGDERRLLREEVATLASALSAARTEAETFEELLNMTRARADAMNLSGPLVD